MVEKTERMIVLSPTLVARMRGMEEAVLFQAILDGGVPIGPIWFEVSNELIMKWLPMWSQQRIKSLLNNLVADKHLYLNSPPFDQSQTIIFSTDPLAMESADTSKTQRAYRESQARRFGMLDDQWKPSESTVQFLEQRFNLTDELIHRFLPDFIGEFANREPSSQSWDSVFVKWAKMNISITHPPASIFERNTESKTAMVWDWEPGSAALEILTNYGVDHDFVKEAVPMFTLYWIERGEAHGTWNTKFINWVRRDWARHTAVLASIGSSTQMTSEWVPSEAVVGILQADKIPSEFFQGIILEFKLYWIESKKLSPSWDSKFLRFVRYQWHNRLKEQGNQSQRDYIASTNIQDRLADMSWAKGL